LERQKITKISNKVILGWAELKTNIRANKTIILGISGKRKQKSSKIRKVIMVIYAEKRHYQR
jgi:hypothetical protein